MNKIACVAKYEQNSLCGKYYKIACVAKYEQISLCGRIGTKQPEG